jgi:hypothetical protein
VEANPMACVAARTKTDWRPDPHELVLHARNVAREADAQLARAEAPR